MVVPFAGSTRVSDCDLGVGIVSTSANQMDKSYDGLPHLA